MQSNTKKNRFGNNSGLIGVGSVLAMELGNDAAKTINMIAASFQVPSGENLASKAFSQGAVAVIRGRVDGFSLNDAFKNLLPTENLEFLRFFNSYEGFNDAVYITGGRSETLSVILFAPYLEDDINTQQNCYGSLSVFGSFGQEKQQFEVV